MQVKLNLGINWLLLIRLQETEIIQTSLRKKLLLKYTFTLCVNGGGLDPSPKAFEAIIAGSIPIIKYSSGIYSAYKDLPVVFINDWSADEINYEKLQTWVSQYRKYYENLELRRETLYKLTFEYWKKHIVNYYNDHI